MKKRGKIITSVTIFTTITTSISSMYVLATRIANKIMYRTPTDDTNSEKTIPGQKVSIKNKQDMVLRGTYIPVSSATRTLIILHPFKQQSSDLDQYITFFQKKLGNTNILAVDARAHGKSDGYIHGLGIRDVEDLALWIRFIKRRNGNHHHILIYGKEMGANTALQGASSKKIHGVDVILSDGAYTSVYDIVARRIKKYRVAPFPLLRLIRKKILHEVQINIKESAVDLVKHNDIPTVFIHTRNDQLVPLKHVYALYNACRGKKELFVLKDETYLYELEEEDDYKKSLFAFIEEYCHD